MKGPDSRDPQSEMTRTLMDERDAAQCWSDTLTRLLLDVYQLVIDDRIADSPQSVGAYRAMLLQEIARCLQTANIVAPDAPH